MQGCLSSGAAANIALRRRPGSASLDVRILHTEEDGVELCFGRRCRVREVPVWDSVSTGEGRKAEGARHSSSSTRVRRSIWGERGPKSSHHKPQWSSQSLTKEFSQGEVSVGAPRSAGVERVFYQAILSTFPAGAPITLYFQNGPSCVLCSEISHHLENKILLADLIVEYAFSLCS